jgi:hypothetical protein
MRRMYMLHDVYGILMRKTAKLFALVELFQDPLNISQVEFLQDIVGKVIILWY